MSKKKTATTKSKKAGPAAPRPKTKGRQPTAGKLEPEPVETAVSESPIETAATQAAAPDAHEAPAESAPAAETEATETATAGIPAAETAAVESITSDASGPAAESNVVANAPAQKMSALDAVAKVLAEAGRPMSCPELIEAMATQGLWTSPGGKTPAATIYASMTKEIVTKRNASRFQKTGRGQFAANPVKNQL